MISVLHGILFAMGETRSEEKKKEYRFTKRFCNTSVVAEHQNHLYSVLLHSRARNTKGYVFRPRSGSAEGYEPNSHVCQAITHGQKKVIKLWLLRARSRAVADKFVSESQSASTSVVTANTCESSASTQPCYYDRPMAGGDFLVKLDFGYNLLTHNTPVVCVDSLFEEDCIPKQRVELSTQHGNRIYSIIVVVFTLPLTPFGTGAFSSAIASNNSVGSNLPTECRASRLEKYEFFR